MRQTELLVKHSRLSAGGKYRTNGRLPEQPRNIVGDRRANACIVRAADFTARQYIPKRYAVIEQKRTALLDRLRRIRIQQLGHNAPKPILRVAVIKPCAT